MNEEGEEEVETMMSGSASQKRPRSPSRSPVRSHGKSARRARGSRDDSSDSSDSEESESDEEATREKRDFSNPSFRPPASALEYERRSLFLRRHLALPDIVIAEMRVLVHSAMLPFTESLLAVGLDHSFSLMFCRNSAAAFGPAEVSEFMTRLVSYRNTLANSHKDRVQYQRLFGVFGKSLASLQKIAVYYGALDLLDILLDLEIGSRGGDTGECPVYGVIPELSLLEWAIAVVDFHDFKKASEFVRARALACLNRILEKKPLLMFGVHGNPEADFYGVSALYLAALYRFHSISQYILGQMASRGMPRGEEVWPQLDINARVPFPLVPSWWRELERDASGLRVADSEVGGWRDKAPPPPPPRPGRKAPTAAAAAPATSSPPAQDAEEDEENEDEDDLRVTLFELVLMHYVPSSTATLSTIQGMLALPFFDLSRHRVMKFISPGCPDLLHDLLGRPDFTEELCWGTKSSQGHITFERMLHHLLETGGAQLLRKKQQQQTTATGAAATADGTVSSSPKNRLLGGDVVGACVITFIHRFKDRKFVLAGRVRDREGRVHPINQSWLTLILFHWPPLFTTVLANFKQLNLESTSTLYRNITPLLAICISTMMVGNPVAAESANSGHGIESAIPLKSTLVRSLVRFSRDAPTGAKLERGMELASSILTYPTFNINTIRTDVYPWTANWNSGALDLLYAMRTRAVSSK